MIYKSTTSNNKLKQHSQLIVFHVKAEWRLMINFFSAMVNGSVHLNSDKKSHHFFLLFWSSGLQINRFQQPFSNICIHSFIGQSNDRMFDAKRSSIQSVQIAVWYKSCTVNTQNLVKRLRWNLSFGWKLNRKKEPSFLYGLIYTDEMQHYWCS